MLKKALSELEPDDLVWYKDGPFWQLAKIITVDKSTSIEAHFWIFEVESKFDGALRVRKGYELEVVIDPWGIIPRNRGQQDT